MLKLREQSYIVVHALCKITAKKPAWIYGSWQESAKKPSKTTNMPRIKTACSLQPMCKLKLPSFCLLLFDNETFNIKICRFKNESTAGADASVEALKLPYTTCLAYSSLLALLRLLALVVCIVQKMGNDRP